MTNKVLVSGAAGQVGSTIVKDVKRNGFDVIGIDFQKHTTVDFCGDFATFDIESEIGEKVNFIHLAAKNDLRLSFEDPNSFYEENYRKPSAFIKKNHRYISKIIYPSSCSVYSPDLLTKQVESDDVLPISPYAESKLLMERFIASVPDDHSIETIIFRAFNIYGNMGAYVLNSHNTERLIPKMLAAAFNGTEFSLHGNDFPTIDGTAVRDYLHIDDFSSLVVRCLKENIHSNNPVHNAGTGIGTSISQMLELLPSLGLHLPRINIKKRMNGDVAYRVADTSKLQCLLNWRPKIGIEEGLSRCTAELLRQHVS